jgi:CBS domain-containing protein
MLSSNAINRIGTGLPDPGAREMDDAVSAGRLNRLRVEDVMTHDVVTATADTTFKQIERLMVEGDITGLPVVGPTGVIIGVVSEADLMLRSEAGGETLGGWSPAARDHRSKAEALTAGGLMSSPAVTVEPDAPLAAAARLMRRGRVKRLPVVDHGRLVGIVTRADVLKSYLRADADILTDVIEGVIRGSMWIDPTTLEIEVDDGVVRMRGQVERRSEVEIIATLTRGVEGVMDVESSLTFRFDDRGVQPPKEQRHV